MSKLVRGQRQKNNERRSRREGLITGLRVSYDLNSGLAKKKRNRKRCLLEECHKRRSYCAESQRVAVSAWPLACVRAHCARIHSGWPRLASTQETNLGSRCAAARAMLRSDADRLSGPSMSRCRNGPGGLGSDLGAEDRRHTSIFYPGL